MPGLAQTIHEFSSRDETWEKTWSQIIILKCRVRAVSPYQTKEMLLLSLIRNWQRIFIDEWNTPIESIEFK